VCRICTIAALLSAINLHYYLKIGRIIKSLIGIAVFLGVGFAACNNTNENRRSENMKNIISIARAVKFYQTILGVSIEQVDMNGTKVGVLPSDGETVNVVLIKGNDYKPTTDGAILYLNAGKDLQPMLNKVEQNGGQVIVPKTEISPEMGFFALFIDTEGNKLGLHSSN
jgi:uncharacterized protein